MTGLETRFRGGNDVAIEDEFLAVLVEQCHAVKAQRVAQDIRRRFRLFDNPDERIGTRDGDSVRLGRATHGLKQRLQLLPEDLRCFRRFRHGERRVVRQNKAVIAFSLDQHGF